MPTLMALPYSVNHLEIHLGQVLRFDLPEEIPGTLVKNKDYWSSLQICPHYIKNGKKRTKDDDGDSVTLIQTL